MFDPVECCPQHFPSGIRFGGSSVVMRKSTSELLLVLLNLINYHTCVRTRVFFFEICITDPINENQFVISLRIRCGPPRALIQLPLVV